MHLLPTAHIVELDDSHRPRISKISEWRVIEGDVTVLSDAKADHVNRSLVEKRGVSATLGFRVGQLTDRMNRTGMDLAVKSLVEKAGESLSRVFR